MTEPKVIAGVDPEALRQLIEKWRSEAVGLSTAAKADCAEELAALLPPASQETK